MFFDMIALFSLFSGFVRSHNLLIPGYFGPEIPSIWRDEKNTEIAMVNIGETIEKIIYL